ncbi:MAG: hypothetical protein SVY10_07020 [Thermodesulfobacteriota bacterium]|nr:hypothetical protein [Thermodesulfobacteriota bacterium]
MMKLRYYIPGSIVILLGLLIIAFPEILIALVAFSLIMFGVGALYFGHLIRKSEVGLRDFSSDFSNSNSYETWFRRVPMWRMRCRNPGYFH